MKAFVGFVVILAMVNDNAATCTGSDADRVYYCKTFQKDYSEGTKTLIFEERDVGLINSTVFSSPNLKSVLTLTLTGSRINIIESGAFEHFSSLITLELQNNRLTTVSPSWFHDPTVLEQLNVAGNLIRQLRPEMLEGYSGLKVLNLSRNEIGRIETESFATLSKLSSLDLSYNKISSLERKVFFSLNVTLKLHGNPWNCSCGQKDFILFLQELVNASRLNDSTLVTCRHPPDLSGVIVWNVSEVNCSISVLSPSSATGLHQIVLPALFVVLENPLPPLLSSTFSEDHAMAKPAMFFTISCASSPNLSQYGNREVCASHHAPFLKDPIQASVNEDDNTAIVATSCAGHLDLPDTSVAFGEHLNDVSPFKLNLVALKDQPAVDVVEEKPRVDDRSVSNLALPTITAQKEVVRSKNINNLSASQLELPTICEPTLGAAVQKTSLENTRTRNVYLPVVGSHKIESVKSLPAIKILEGDNVKDNQYVEPEISSNKIITLTDPGFDGNPFFENQVSQFETQKTQIVSEPDVAIAAISSSTSNLVGMISNHGEVTTLEHESTHTQEPCKLTDFSTVSLDTEMHLTTSVSYANSTQDGEDVSDWPKIADLVKHSSTISLSSNFDILNPNLTTHFNTHYENLFYDSSKPNAELSVDLRDRPETMDNQPCDIDDHDNMMVEGLSFKCDVLHQYNSETDNTKGSNGMEYETFYIQDGTREHYENPNDEKTRIRILDTKSKVTVQPDVKSQFLESAEKMPFEIENLEKIGDMHHNLDSHIINDNIVESTSYDDITQTFSVDMEVNSTAHLQTSNEDHCRDQTEEVVYVNGKTVKHKGHHLTTPFKNRHSEEHKGQEDLSENLTRPPDVQTQTSEAEDPPSQTNTSDLSTTVRTAAVEFEGYDDKSNERVNTNLGMMDINHDAGNCDEILNIFQDILKSDSAAVSEKICSSPGSKAADLLDAETSSDALNTHYEKDDFRGIEYKLKENDCNSDESVNALRKAKVDLPNYITVCNSDATFNNGQVNRVGAMDASLCNTEIPLEDNQMLSDIQKIPKTYTKQTCSNQKSKTNRPLKTTNKIPPANAKDKLYLKDFLSSRVYRRQFHSAFNFLANTLNTEEDEVVKNPTVEGEPSSSDLATARPCLKLSDMQPINKTMQAAEYLTYLYARSPKQKACPGSLEEVEVLGDIDDISVLANLHFCKVALPGEVGKREMSTDVQQVNADPKVEAADPDNVYIPPSKKELKADDELAVLHVICTLKRSLELSISNEMETD